jgi:hypothetical protein
MPAVAERRRTIAGAWYEQLLGLTQTAALETPAGERTLDALVARLRRLWMTTAHEYADATYRSPPHGEPKELPSHATISYGYERTLERTPLDARLDAYHPVPAGWSARHLLFSSGMGALAALVQSVRAFAGDAPRPDMLVSAAYFETLDLLALETHGCSLRFAAGDATFARATAEQPPAIAFVEPILYDPWLVPFDVARATGSLARTKTPPVVVVDSTLVGPALPMPNILAEAPGLPLVVQISSGLKLDQAGLELANVGIVSLYAPDANRALLVDAFERLVRVRRLTGTALPIDSVALLDVPFFLNPVVFRDYTGAVFRHNARLARAVPAGALFETVAHPSSDPRGLPWAQAPFVFFHLREDEPRAYVALEQLVLGEGARRDIVVEGGGSFGFRGHRCEAVVLERGPRRGVLKVALGAREGPSLERLIALLREIAAYPSVAAAAPTK